MLVTAIIIVLILMLLGLVRPGVGSVNGVLTAVLLVLLILMLAGPVDIDCDDDNGESSLRIDTD